MAQFDSDICNAGQNLTLHIVPDSNIQLVVFVQGQRGEVEEILVMADAPTFRIALQVDEIATERIATGVARRYDTLFHYEVQTHERIVATDAQTDFLPVMVVVGNGADVEDQRIVTLPACQRCMLVVVVHGALLAGYSQPTDTRARDIEYVGANSSHPSAVTLPSFSCASSLHGQSG